MINGVGVGAVFYGGFYGGGCWKLWYVVPVRLTTEFPHAKIKFSDTGSHGGRFFYSCLSERSFL